MLDALDLGQIASIAGTVAGTLSVGAFLPQAWRIYRRRSAADVSLLMYLSIIVGCVLWMFYAWVRGSTELFVTNLVIAGIAFVIAALKLRFGGELSVLAAGRNPFALAARDIGAGVASIHIWPTLGWLEIRQRYRRSVLGPFWLTLSTGFLIAAMGPLYGRLFNQDFSSYLPFLAIGFVVWLFLAGLINDACTTFISAEGYIKQMKLPFTVHVMRMVWRNLIIFLHNTVIVVLVLFAWPPPATAHLLLVPLAVLLIAVNGVWIGLSVGLMCARFRDIPQIIASLVQVAFFLTPVMWQAGMLGRHQWAALWNPFHHFIELIRAPLVGSGTSWLSWGIALGITAGGCALTFLLFARYRARIAYWV